jgi:hypothetical protein
MEQLNSDHSSYMQNFMDDDLMYEYFRSVRPFLVSCSLVCGPDHLNHPAKILHLNNEHFISREPNYLTSLDLMKRLKLLHSS